MDHSATIPKPWSGEASSMNSAVIEANTNNRSAQNVNPNENNENNIHDLRLDLKLVEPECVYSKPIDALDSNNENFTNGISVTRSDNSVKQEVFARSNDTSISTDIPANGTLRRILRSLSFVKKKETPQRKDEGPDSSKKPVVYNRSKTLNKEKGTLTLTFNSSKKKVLRTADIPYVTDESSNCKECVCIRYKRTREHPLGEGVVFSKNWPNAGSLPSVNESSGFTSDDHYKEVRHIDEEKSVRVQNRKAKEEVDSPRKYRPHQTAFILETHCKEKQPVNDTVAFEESKRDDREADSTRTSQFDRSFEAHMNFSDEDDDVSIAADLYPTNACSFFWGKMNQEEADRLLEGKQEGMFLLREDENRDQEYVASFRKLGRTRHARIERRNNEFSFNFHDSNSHISDTVCGLIEKYRDTSCYPFFEPVLTVPLDRYSF